MIKVVEKPDLPKEIFKVEVKPQLLAQAVRVYLANQRQGTQSALTRADINRTRKKLYKQKGTGGARHGDRKAPIFVGGGVAFAPKPRDYSLSLPKKMRKSALYSALTAKNKDKKVLVVSGLSKLTGKTAEVAKFLEKEKIGQCLVLTDILRDNIYRAMRNIATVTVMPIKQANVYEILKAEVVLMMEEAIDSLSEQSKSKEIASTVQSTKSSSRRKVKSPSKKSV